ncbi:MAG: hypothetical protein GY754_26035 [bacterium]|nr:hypothetical protein [bacterium]
MNDLLIPLEETENLVMGTILRRISKEKDQQGCFIQKDENGSLILINVLDFKNKALAASEGLLKPQKDDNLYYYQSSFKDNPFAMEAFDIVKNWPLYKKNEKLQNSMLKFVASAYVPEQILEWQKSDSLELLFIPIQQKLRIGRYKEQRDPNRISKEQFKSWLDTLDFGEHITYLAQVLPQKDFLPKFFSAGTRPHQVTESALMETEFNFKPTHGGHIKVIKSKSKKKRFLVDAGSEYIGRGTHAPLVSAEEVTEGLKKIFPAYEYTPIEGRGAFGNEQSF